MYSFLQCFDYLVNQCTRRNRVKSYGSLSASIDESKSKKRKSNLYQRSPPEENGTGNNINESPHSEKKAVQIDTTTPTSPSPHKKFRKLVGSQLHRSKKISNVSTEREVKAEVHQGEDDSGDTTCSSSNFSDSHMKFSLDDVKFPSDTAILRLPRKTCNETKMTSPANFNQANEDAEFTEPRVTVTLDMDNSATTLEKNDISNQQLVGKPADTAKNWLNRDNSTGNCEPHITITLEGEDAFTSERDVQQISTEADKANNERLDLSKKDCQTKDKGNTSSEDVWLVQDGVRADITPIDFNEYHSLDENKSPTFEDASSERVGKYKIKSDPDNEIIIADGDDHSGSGDDLKHTGKRRSKTSLSGGGRKKKRSSTGHSSKEDILNASKRSGEDSQEKITNVLEDVIVQPKLTTSKSELSDLHRSTDTEHSEASTFSHRSSTGHSSKEDTLNASKRPGEDSQEKTTTVLEDVASSPTKAD